MPKIRQKLISTNEAAARLNEHPRTVQRKAESGEYEAQKLPGLRGAYVFTESYVKSLIEKRIRDAAKHVEPRDPYFTEPCECGASPASQIGHTQECADKHNAAKDAA